MRTILHILTRPDDELTRELPSMQRSLPATKVETIDLRVSAPDYDALVGKVFAADSVEVF